LLRACVRACDVCCYSLSCLVFSGALFAVGPHAAGLYARAAPRSPQREEQEAHGHHHRRARNGTINSTDFTRNCHKHVKRLVHFRLTLRFDFKRFWSRTKGCHVFSSTFPLRPSLSLFVLHKMVVQGQTVKMVEINFLCVHKKLRSKRLAPVLIKEITRRVNVNGIFQVRTRS